MPLKKVLVVDNTAGGHAMALRLNESPQVGRVFVAPGNGATAGFATSVGLSGVEELTQFASREPIDLTFVGSESALAAAIVNRFERLCSMVVGPRVEAAQIQSSQTLAKSVMVAAGVPTASWAFFTDYHEARAHAQSLPGPAVVKFDGLTNGTGSFVCTSVAERHRALHLLMGQKIFGEGGVVIEECLQGREASFHAFVDVMGNAAMTPPVLNYRRRYDANEGTNTAGMGSVGPAPYVDAGMTETVKTTIILPIVQQLAQQGRPFVGCLSVNVMLTADGPKVLGLSARPDHGAMQVLMRLLNTDLYDVLWACMTGSLDTLNIRWRSGYAVSVGVVAYEYPDPGPIGLPLIGLDAAAQVPGGLVYHGDTRQGHEGMYFSTGRQPLSATCYRDDLSGAVNGAQEMASLLVPPNWQGPNGLDYRRDIGLNLVSDDTQM